MRNRIEPDFDTAEQRYPEVLQLILAYTDFYDENGDEDMIEYKRMEIKLNEITGKDMSAFDLWEWWEGEGVENLAFNICLPEPVAVDHLTKEELTEIVRRLMTFDIPDPEDKTFNSQFYNYVCFGNDFYHKLLKMSGVEYDNQLFQSHKDKEGNYFEYSQEEIIDQLWAGRKIIH